MAGAAAGGEVGRRAEGRRVWRAVRGGCPSRDAAAAVGARRRRGSRRRPRAPAAAAPPREPARSEDCLYANVWTSATARTTSGR